MSLEDKGTEEEKRARREKKEIEALKGRARARKVGAAIDALLKTEAGQILFKELFFMCGYNRPSLLFDQASGKVDENGTALNDVRRALYIQLRRLATLELLAPVELSAEVESREATKTPDEQETK